MTQAQVQGINLIIDAWEKYAPSNATFEGFGVHLCYDLPRNSNHDGGCTRDAGRNVSTGRCTS